MATGSVDSQTIGTYSIYYNVKDSQNASAQQKVRTVIVKARPAVCVGNCGGGPSSTPLNIFNEKVEAKPDNSALITWQTNVSADSRVVYGANSVNSLVFGHFNYGYATTTVTENGLVLSHSLLITSIQPDIHYYFRPVSDNPSADPAVGKELTLIIAKQPPVVPPVVPPAGEAGPPAPVECNYLLEYLRIDLPNNPVEVTKLQRFLKENEGFADLQVNGVFGQATLDAVNIFQMRYFPSVLSPWGYDYNQPTGYVYITTKKRVNEIYCQRPFPLTQEQNDEIAFTRNALQSLMTASTSAPTPAPLVGQVESKDNVAQKQNATGTSVAVNVGNIDNAVPTGPPTIKVVPTGENRPVEESEPEEPLFLASIVNGLTNAKNIVMIEFSLIVLFIALAFVFIFVAVKRRRKPQEPLVNFSVPDSLPVMPDKL